MVFLQPESVQRQRLFSTLLCALLWVRGLQVRTPFRLCTSPLQKAIISECSSGVMDLVRYRVVR